MEAGTNVERFGTIRMNEESRIEEFEEKPLQAKTNTISCGIYVVRRRLLIEMIETFLHNAIRHHGYEVDSESVVQLIKCGELKKIPTNGEDLYTYQKPSDCCTMLLEGLVECEIGKEKIITEKSRFSVFGFLALIEDNYMYVVALFG